jgi:hypothetical protein
VLTVTLLVPVLFLMAVVVFYGCLLAVLTHRVGLQAVIGRRRPIGAFVEPDRPMPTADRPLIAEPAVVRFLIVVSRHAPGRYEELRRLFGSQANTDVIFDRRRPHADSPRTVTWTSRAVDRRQRQVDEDLRLTGWAMLRLTEPRES